MSPREKAGLVHLALSTTVAAVVAVLVFQLWYPGDYGSLSGGQDLFILVMLVDIIIGPLLTLVVFASTKSTRQLRFDLFVIGVFQCAALTYGLHVVYVARPVVMVFEVDRFRVLTIGQIDQRDLQSASAEFGILSLAGPRVLGTRKPRAGAESNQALWKAVGGVDIAQRPSFWQPYAVSRSDALARSRPVELLSKKYPSRRDEIRIRVRKSGLSEAVARFLPVVARGDWVALLDSEGDVVGFIPLDGFF
ncbi:fimb protein [soil metagenome]